MEIECVSSWRAYQIMMKGKPKGLFYCVCKDVYIGIDNSTGEVWTEEFHNKEDCVNWLINKERIA